MQFSQFEDAASRLKGVIHATPVSSSITFSKMCNAEVYLKCENLQKTGSFKVRGAYNKVAKMAEAGRLAPLVAASAGNHAQGVAYAANAAGVRSIIVMPRSTPIAKISATEGYGAEVILAGSCFDEAYAHALQLQEELGATFIHPFDDEDVIAGQGTISLEILATLPTVDAVLVPAGGGGLLSGIGACIKQVNPRVRVIGVQAEHADALVQSYHSGCRITTPTSATIADGIAVRCPGELTTQLINQYADEMVTVTDDEIAEAILLLLERTKMIVEPAGAAALAAALQRKVDIRGQRVVCLLSGGNIDVGFIHRVVEKGLITRGRQMKFFTKMEDVPGNLEKFASVIAGKGGNIVMVQHDRLHSDLRFGEALLHVACEVSSREHGTQLIDGLAQAGYHITLES